MQNLTNCGRCKLQTMSDILYNFIVLLPPCYCLYHVRQERERRAPSDDVEGFDVGAWEDGEDIDMRDGFTGAL